MLVVVHNKDTAKSRGLARKLSTGAKFVHHLPGRIHQRLVEAEAIPAAFQHFAGVGFGNVHVHGRLEIEEMEGACVADNQNAAAFAWRQGNRLQAAGGVDQVGNALPPALV